MKLVQLLRKGREGAMSSIGYAVASKDPHGILQGVNIHFDTPGVPGKYIVQMSPEEARKLCRDIANGERKPPTH